MLSIILNLILPIIAIIISIFAFTISLKTLKLQTLSDLLKEYRSPQMGASIQYLWDYFSKCNSDELKLIDNYIKQYYKDIKINTDPNNTKFTLHKHRRIVSHYYETLAAYYFNNLLFKSTFNKLWTKETLEIINNILYPIETKALTQITKNKVISNKVDLMYNLYKKI